MIQKIKYQVSQLEANQAKTASIAIGIYQDNKLTAAAALIDKASGGYIKKLLGEGDFAGNIGQSLVLYEVPKVQTQRVLLIGLRQGKTKHPAGLSENVQRTH